MRRSTKTPRLRVIGFCEGNSPVTGEFHAQMASNAENDPIWHYHGLILFVKIGVGLSIYTLLSLAAHLWGFTELYYCWKNANRYFMNISLVVGTNKNARSK